MTQLPPPVATPMNYGRPATPPPQSNAWAIVSLICGIIGCLLVTPVVAIVTGLVGISKSKQQGGRGMAIAGLILGVVWLVIGAVAIGGGVTLFKNASNLLVFGTKPQTIMTINRLGNGTAATTRDASTAALSDADVQSVVDTVARLGQCRDFTVSNSKLNAVNGEVTVDFDGTAQFDKGTAGITGRLKIDKTGNNPNAAMLYEKLELK